MPRHRHRHLRHLAQERQDHRLEAPDAVLGRALPRRRDTLNLAVRRALLARRAAPDLAPVRKHIGMPPNRLLADVIATAHRLAGRDAHPIPLLERLLDPQPRRAIPLPPRDAVLRRIFAARHPPAPAQTGESVKQLPRCCPAGLPPDRTLPIENSAESVFPSCRSLRAGRRPRKT